MFTIETVLNRMWNWKMESAFKQAQTIESFPKPALSTLKQLSKKFGNCGWQEGNVFDELRNKNHQVADMLGYKWNDDEDNWILNSKAVLTNK